MKIEIPNYSNLDIQNIVFDYNGTLASGGRVLSETKNLLSDIAKRYNTFVITADTFGTVADELKDIDLEVIVLGSDDHTSEKSALIDRLGKDITIAMGNGNNDHMMLKNAVVSIAIIGDEGCSMESMICADIVCKNIMDAMSLLLDTKRLIATLRR